MSPLNQPKPKGTCRVCGRTGLTLYRVGEVGPQQPDGTQPGWVWGHKNQGTACTGSWEAPAASSDHPTS